MPAGSGKAEDMKKGDEPAGAAGNNAIKLKIGASQRIFDIDNPKLPDWVDKRALRSGGFPYDKKMPEEAYEEELETLQIELVKLQAWMHRTGSRVLAIFEGRDAAGKGGTINAVRQNLNPRSARNVALPKPTETERGQWYFQRYINHFPTTGEFVTFDRSWYNRAGVEPVMGFCTPEQYAKFLKEVPRFEKMIVREDIHFFKFWIDIGREMQLKRFHERRHSLLRNWKFSPIDVAGMSKWDDYSEKRDVMLEKTHTDDAPWIVVRGNDKRRARLAAIRRILLTIAYENRDLDAIGKEDKQIIGEGARFLAE
jgi:polyphosphate kinase 2